MSEFHLNLTLTENEVLQSMARQACFTGIGAALAGFQEQLKNYYLVRRDGRLADAFPEPSLERTMKEIFNWTAVLQRLTEDLRVAFRQGDHVVVIGRTEYEALYSLAQRDWSKNDGSVEAMAMSMAVETCKVGIQAALEAARVHLDRQTEPTNVFTPPGAARN